MKKNIIRHTVLAVLLLPLLTGCQDFLDTESKSTYTSQVVFSTPTYTNMAITGIYSAFFSVEVWVNFYYQFNTDIEIQQYGTAAGSWNDTERRGIGNYVATPANTGLSRAWNAYYQAVERANLCVSEIRKSPLLENGSEEDKGRMRMFLGEALTLRAYLYMELVRCWGDVPFKTDPTDPEGSNFNLPKTDRDEIYEYLLSDLEEAAGLLPWLGEESYATTPERVTKGFAKGLRARIALYRGGYSFRTSMQMERGSNWEQYYEIARQECQEIINNGTHKLDPSYESLWKTLNGSQFNAYNENLMEFGYQMGQSGEQGYIAGWRYSQSDKWGYGNMGAINSPLHFLYSFNPSDSRRAMSVGLGLYGTTGKMEIFTNPMSLTIGKWNKKWMPDAYINLMKGASGKIVTGVNWVPMRMADVYLMLAETENELSGGSVANAQAALRVVRARAFNTAAAAVYTEMVDNYVSSLSKGESMRTALENERAWEFAGESVRKWDLIRWNKLTSKIQEAREANRRAINQQPPYTNVPTYVFYRYSEADTDELEILNLDTNRGSADIEGYTRAAWFPANYSNANNATNYAAYNDFLRAWACGLDGGEGWAATYKQDRHLLPIPTSAIDASGGILKNDYGF
ncbi:MAG: RagB/SusD family nutrient uptake outer membrane protein [Rikenellaceae bacterium]|jgi:hypothetical protein|nr:RagB/SusD family nutrient uptake outer membrane protein [Rikenellaceae bacterium]